MWDGPDHTRMVGAVARDGAGDGIRTRDSLLGRQMRYHCATPAQVGARGFEPRTSWSQTKRAAELRYAPWGVVYSKGNERSNFPAGGKYAIMTFVTRQLKSA
jgi:hypothetical protein